MDRPIVYAGAQPLETDILNLARNTMIGLGRLTMDLLGTSTAVSGLACTPTGGMSVAIGAGAIYQNVQVDPSAYSSLSANTTDYIMKQGILSASAGLTLAMSAPVTVGQSIIYLVEAEFLETDTNPATLYYYNASNPSVPWVGPSNTGTAQNTTRSDTCVVQAKAGVASSSPVAPTVDAGFVPLYTVTIPYGTSVITSGMIAVAPSAPFLPGTLGNYAPLASPGFTGTPTAPTPPQFDNTTKLATTAFVQRQVGNFSGYSSLSGTQTLGAGNAGQYVVNSTTGTASWTLPNATINTGYCLCIENAGTGVLTLTSGGGNFKGPLGNNTTTLAIAVGQTIEMVADGAAWHCYAGTAGVALTGTGFAASLTTNGYQKLPSGLILQWGVTGSVSSEGAIAVTFPIAFPTACLNATSTMISSAANNLDQGAQVLSLSTTGMSVYMQQYGGGSWTWPVTAYWHAIGY